MIFLSYIFQENILIVFQIDDMKIYLRMMYIYMYGI